MYKTMSNATFVRCLYTASTPTNRRRRRIETELNDSIGDFAGDGDYAKTNSIETNRLRRRLRRNETKRKKTNQTKNENDTNYGNGNRALPTPEKTANSDNEQNFDN